MLPNVIYWATSHLSKCGRVASVGVYNLPSLCRSAIRNGGENTVFIHNVRSELKCSRQRQGRLKGQFLEVGERSQQGYLWLHSDQDYKWYCMGHTRTRLSPQLLSVVPTSRWLTVMKIAGQHGWVGVCIGAPFSEPHGFSDKPLVTARWGESGTCFQFTDSLNEGNVTNIMSPAGLLKRGKSVVPSNRLPN